MPTLRISKEMHEAMREWNERNHGRGISPGAVSHEDGTVSFQIDQEVADRLAQLSPDPEAALGIALGITKIN